MPNSLLPQKNSQLFSNFFSKLKDPRRTNKGNFFYSLEEILFLSVSAVISGADSWTSIHLFGKSKLGWLQQFYPYKNGIPSHDVLGKVFAALDPVDFSRCFTDWINSIAELTQGEVVAIDGKCVRRSGDKQAGKSALHIVSAYAAENCLCLGQEAVDEKSNEITAIPKLLDLLAVQGCIVTIDAIGCQKEVAKTIIEKGADYLLMVKDNQKGLKEQVEKVFAIAGKTDVNQQVDLGHGRIEKRVCQVSDQLQFLDDKEEWKAMKSIVQITSERIIKQTGGNSRETRYYISSLPADAKMINKAVRQHWAVENKLHWVLDVIFKEDASLKKQGNSARNFNIIAKMALSLIDQEKSTKMSKPSKRLRAALDDSYRAKILKV